MSPWSGLVALEHMAFANHQHGLRFRRKLRDTQLALQVSPVGRTMGRRFSRRQPRLLITSEPVGLEVFLGDDDVYVEHGAWNRDSQRRSVSSVAEGHVALFQHREPTDGRLVSGERARHLKDHFGQDGNLVGVVMTTERMIVNMTKRRSDGLSVRHFQNDNKLG